jgi:transcriptional regulator with XRE-family HTH domain
MTHLLFFSSLEALQAFTLQSSLEDFKVQLSYLSPAEIAQALFVLQKESSPPSLSKLEHLFHFIDSPENLEKVARVLSVSQFLAVLGFLHQHASYQNRLLYILVGLRYSVFSQALQMCQPEHLTLLKHESLFEPLQYQLNQFVHESEALQKHTD